jgi:DNA end-binding protein Ku
MRSVWSGNLAFGLVSIPVRLYPATEAKDVRFHLVDPQTGRRVRYRRIVERDDVEDGSAEDEVVPEEDERTSEAASPDESTWARDAGGSSATRSDGGSREVEVTFDELDRSYEVEPGEEVSLTREELDRLRPQRSRTIDIEDFVDLSSIDPVYFEKSYIVAPEGGGVSVKPYVLLMRALERAGRVGIGRFVLRTKPHLVAIRVRSGVLALETLFFGDEVRETSALAPAVPSASIDDRELRLAEDLVGMLATEWDPSAYADTYRQELLSLIEGKTARRRPAPDVSGTTPPGSDAEALMDALRRSVDEAKRRRTSPPAGDASEAV